ncbi:MAG: ThiF family adenylyltransferase [Deltaproteobacteria bacterium]|nr:MAG: ThiF family adenylyltransferase [Deltaproteobacteria bacterium]
MTFLHHEELYRSPHTLERLAQTSIVVCGAGALGANLLESLARCGAQKLTVIDRDRVEERNLSTQPYYRSDVGSLKAKILAGSLYRAVGVAVNAQATELKESNARKLLKGADVVVDVFDNSVSRALVQACCDTLNIPCLHAGMASDYAEVIWDPHYKVPSDAHDDICDYPLARNLVGLCSAITCEVLLRFVDTQVQEHYTLTFADLRILPWEG